MDSNQKVKQYYFSKIESGFDNIHSFIRENFESHDNPTPSLVKGDLIVVQSNLKPQLSNPIVEHDPILPFEVAKEVKIICHLSFDNRHNSGNVIPKRLSPTEALIKLETLVGLIPLENASTSFLGCHKEKKFNVHNTFKFEGWFRVTDIKKLNKCIINGAGSRKSYGYGLILIEEKKE